MAYQCDRCNGWTADSQKHNCVYDELAKLRADYEDLKARFKDVATENHFKMCPNCEPIMCCTGYYIECGCYGLPVDYSPTDKCDESCVLRCFKERDELKKKYEPVKKEG